MKVVEAKVDPAKVQVAIEIDSADEPAIVADLVTLYRWGRTKFDPIKCGEEYPPELCSIGEVHILFLKPVDDVPSTTGPVDGVYLTQLEIWLDQIQIDVMLDPSVAPTSFAELDQLHATAAEKNGGGAEEKNELFTGLK